MKNRISKVICTFVTVAVAILSSVFIFAPDGVAEANSAWYRYNGINSIGAIVKNGDCPIVVDREDLTFDIYDDDHGYLYDYYETVLTKGKVSAKYTFRNPDDISADVGLLFPIGYELENESYYIKDNKEYYSVKVNGNDIDKRIRYTFKERKNKYNESTLQFHFVEDRKFLSDEYINATGLERDKTVYKYTCTAKDGYNVYEYVDLIYYDANCRILCAYDDENGNSGSVNGKYGEIPYAQVNCDKDGNIVFFATQKLSDSTLLCRAESKKYLPYEYAGEVTIEDAVMSAYDESEGIERVDWYNAFIARACSDSESEFVNTYFAKGRRFRWYDYSLIFAPGETIVNEVVAPMYPSVTNEYIPRIYNFTYLSSPAKMWASFGEFHLRINTDMYVKDASVGKLKKHKGYYEYSCNGLPANELTFSVCSSAAPITRNAWWGLVMTGIALAATSVIWLPILIVIIIKVRKKRKLKKAAKESAEQTPAYVPVPCQDDDSLNDDGVFDEETMKNGEKTAETCFHSRDTFTEVARRSE